VGIASSSGTAFCGTWTHARRLGRPHWIAWRTPSRGGPFRPALRLRELVREAERRDPARADRNPPSPEWIERVSEAKERTYRRLLRERASSPCRAPSNGWGGCGRPAGNRPSPPPPRGRTSTRCSTSSALRGSSTPSSPRTRWDGESPTRPSSSEAARRLGVPPTRCVVVEDAPAGSRAPVGRDGRDRGALRSSRRPGGRPRGPFPRRPASGRLRRPPRQR